MNHPLDEQYEIEREIRIKTGGPAFPRPCDDQKTFGEDGMSMRDYFAAKAMPIMWDAYDKGYCGVIDPDTFDNDALARGSYLIADAMLKARKL